MNEATTAPDYKRHRFPPAISAHAVWLYFRFALRYRDVAELLAARGVILTYRRRSASGVASSARATPARYAVVARGLATMAS